MDLTDYRRERFGNFFVLLLAIGISFVFFGMIKRMAVALLLAAIFAGMFHPMFRKFVVWFGGRRALAALVTVTVLILLVFIPLSVFLGIVAAQAVEVTQSVGPWIERQIEQPDRLDQLLWSNPRLEWLQPYQQELMTKISELAGMVGSFLVNSVAAATQGNGVFPSQQLRHALRFLLLPDLGQRSPREDPLLHSARAGRREPDGREVSLGHASDSQRFSGDRDRSGSARRCGLCCRRDRRSRVLGNHHGRAVDHSRRSEPVSSGPLQLSTCS